MGRRDDQVQVFHCDGAQKHRIAQYQGAGEASPILKAYLDGTDVGDNVRPLVSSRHFAFFNFGKLQLNGDVFGNADGHGAGVDQGGNRQGAELRLLRVRELNRRRDHAFNDPS